LAEVCRRTSIGKAPITLSLLFELRVKAWRHPELLAELKIPPSVLLPNCIIAKVLLPPRRIEAVMPPPLQGDAAMQIAHPRLWPFASLERRLLPCIRIFKETAQLKALAERGGGGGSKKAGKKHALQILVPTAGEGGGQNPQTGFRQKREYSGARWPKCKE